MALHCGEIGHELLTFWAVANISSIPGWHVQGAHTHPACVTARVQMFPEVAFAAAGPTAFCTCPENLPAC